MQFFESVRVFVHEPLQTVRPPWHVAAHAEPEHTWPIMHVLPAFAPEHGATAPQCWLFVVGSMHAPPQSISVPGQETVHTPATHASPAGHPLPQLAVLLQYWLLVSRSTHVPTLLLLPPSAATCPQKVSPFKQDGAQMPEPLHVVPAAQATPAVPPSPTRHAPLAPQCRLSVVGSMHLPPQLISLGKQLTKHLPAAHA